jgi:hypothetical protein
MFELHRYLKQLERGNRNGWHRRWQLCI